MRISGNDTFINVHDVLSDAEVAIYREIMKDYILSLHSRQIGAVFSLILAGAAKTSVNLVASAPPGPYKK